MTTNTPRPWTAEEMEQRAALLETCSICPRCQTPDMQPHHQEGFQCLDCGYEGDRSGQPFQEAAMLRQSAETERAVARVRELAERWSDPEYWHAVGGTEDSIDCSRHLLAALLTPTGGTI